MSPHLYFPQALLPYMYHPKHPTITWGWVAFNWGVNLGGALRACPLAWCTGHPVGGLHHPGTCHSRRAFQTILAYIGLAAKPGPASLLATLATWLVVSSTSWCHHSWGLWNVTQAHGILLPLPQLLPNQSVTSHNT